LAWKASSDWFCDTAWTRPWISNCRLVGRGAFMAATVMARDCAAQARLRSITRDTQARNVVTRTRLPAGPAARADRQTGLASLRFAAVEIELHAGAIRVMAKQLPRARALLPPQLVSRALRVEARLHLAQVARGEGDVVDDARALRRHRPVRIQ